MRSLRWSAIEVQVPQLLNTLVSRSYCCFSRACNLFGTNVFSSFELLQFSLIMNFLLNSGRRLEVVLWPVSRDTKVRWLARDLIFRGLNILSEWSFCLPKFVQRSLVQNQRFLVQNQNLLRKKKKFVSIRLLTSCSIIIIHINTNTHVPYGCRSMVTMYSVYTSSVVVRIWPDILILIVYSN